jgi:alpha,alpha-trehalase
MADDSSYYPDVIRWIVAHPHQGGDGYLVKGSEHPDAAGAAGLKQTSCDVNASHVCMRAWAEGFRLTRDFYVGDRAMRESGFDPSNRFGPFSGETHHFAPVCLNSLLYRYERDMEHIAHVLGKPADAARWDREATKRNAAIHQYLWRPKEGVFADWDFQRARPDPYAYVTSLYPLWGGVATREEAKQVVAKLGLFERPGGLSMSNANTGLQWDEPFGWAPTNWIGVAGLESSGFHADAARLAQKWDATVDEGFAQEKTIREKYNVAAANADVHVATGYKENQIGFGWTNAVYLKMKGIVERQVASTGN